MHSRTLPYLLIAPAIIFLLVFFVYPFLLVAWQAFATDEGVLTTKYFTKMVKHWKFDKALTNTFLLVLAIVPVQLVLYSFQELYPLPSCPINNLCSLMSRGLI